jgi:pimeloyl-ACP methyl ester carboxylesterase
MPRANSNGIDIEYETFGDRSGSPLLLIMGLGAQLLSWDEEFCAALADRGFFAIRYDNRDAGLSTRMEAAGAPDIAAAVSGDPKPAYQLDDLADDAVGLLDALDIRAAHIVGASMGGYIAQLVAINHPEHTLSLTSIMSGPALAEGVAATPEGVAVMLEPPPPTREERIKQSMWIRSVLIGSGDPYDEASERRRAVRNIDRAYYPVGTGRQLVSVLAAHNRLEALRQLRVPAVVIHGVDDILIPVENGRLVAAAVPGARLVEIEGMGHDLPKRAWPVVLDAIAEVARKADALQPR